MTPLRFAVVAFGLFLAVLTGSGHAQPPLLPEAAAGRIDGRLQALEARVWRDPWSARAALEAMRPELAASSDATAVAHAVLLAQALLFQHVDDEFAAAIDAGRQRLSADTPRRLRYALDLYHGVRLGRAGEFERAREQLAAVRDAAAAAGMRGIATLAAVELGYAHTLSGRHDDALQVLQSAYEDAVDVDDPFLVALVNEVFGVLYTYLDQVDSAIRHYRMALQEYEALGYPLYVAEAVYGIGITHRYAGEWKAALAAFERYRALTEARSDLHGRFSAAYGLATTLADMGDCPAAMRWIEVALDTPGPQDYKAEVLKRAAVCHAQAGDVTAAQDALDGAKAILGSLPSLEGSRWEIDLLQREAEVQAALGEHAAAYELLRRFLNENTALMRRNTSERIVAQRDALENARQALQIELLQEQARVRALEIEQQQRDIGMQRIGVALLIIAFLLAAAVAWWRLRDMRRYRDMSRQDALTGLANRRHVFERLETLLRGLDSQRGDLALLVLDIDDFKAINDRYGHPVGDVVLQSVADALRDALRPGDEVARIGGEEFLMILPRTDATAAMGVAWRLHECLQDLPMRAGGGRTVEVTASIGVASTRGLRCTVEELYAAADEALYRAKSGGKNRCELATPKRPARDPVPDPVPDSAG